jgi:hypothetical protein
MNIAWELSTSRIRPCGTQSNKKVIQPRCKLFDLGPAQGRPSTYHVKLTRPELWEQLLAHVAAYLIPGRTLRPTLHAQAQAERRGLLLPTVLPTEGVVVVEVSPGKCLLRLPYHGHLQREVGARSEMVYGNGWLCLSVNEAGDIITAYYNAGGDEHTTLDRSRYIEAM